MLACALLLGAADPTPPKAESAFDILGASVKVDVERGGMTLPATFVPRLEPGDIISMSFPKGVQFSRSPRWHLIVANMYDDYLQHAPTFVISDSDLSRSKPGAVWPVVVSANATPLIFLVPEDGSRYGRGMPDARTAIVDLSNRALLLKTASLSATAQAKASTMDSFLRSLASIQPGELPDGRARVEEATQSLFGSDLGGSACFTTSVAEATQYACAAQAVASGYSTTPTLGVGEAIGNELSIGAATYGMLIGTIYELLAKRRVAAHYTFVPGVIRPGTNSTDVYVAQQPQYDATASKPSTIVYFTIGSRATSLKTPSYGAVPNLAACLNDLSLDVNVPFSGLPIYFRSHTISFKSGAHTFELPATYDVLRGYHAQLSSQQVEELAGGGTATISSEWGFDTFHSAPARIVEPHAVHWALQTGNGTHIVSGDKTSTLTFADAGANQGGCVKSIDVRDGLGRAIPVTRLERSDDSISATLDTSNARGATGSATVEEEGGVAITPIAFSLLPAMPSISSAIAYLPKGVLVLKGTGLKYINAVTLEHTGIIFGSGTPNADGSWAFTAQSATSYKPEWEHETMAISFTLQPPDTRTDAAEVDVEYAPSPSPAPSPR